MVEQFVKRIDSGIKLMRMYFSAAILGDPTRYKFGFYLFHTIIDLSELLVVVKLRLTFYSA